MRFLPALLLVAALGVGQQVSASDNTIDWKLYHSTESILEHCSKLARYHPALASWEEIPDPESQFRLPVLTLTDFTVKKTKPVVLLVAGEHSRELITSEIVYWFSALLTDTPSFQPAANWAALEEAKGIANRKGWAESDLQSWAKILLQQVTFKIVPVLNVAGRKAVEGGDLCLRKTVSGVDLNRNWPYAWQQTEASLDDHGGIQPFSEPESRVVKLLAETESPHAYVNLHSGEWAMYVPWDSKETRAPNLPADTEGLLESMNEYCQCMNGPAGKVAGYLALGSSMDWMYAEHHVPYSLTFEVYGPKDLGKLSAGGHPRLLLQDLALDKDSMPASVQNSTLLRLSDDSADASTSTKAQSEGDMPQHQDSSSSSPCFSMFNPSTRAEYESVVGSWIGTLLVLARHVHRQPLQSLASFHAEQLQQPKLTDSSLLSSTDPKRSGKQVDVFSQSHQKAKSELNRLLGRKGQIEVLKSGLGIEDSLPVSIVSNRPEEDEAILGYSFANSFSQVLLGVFTVAGIVLVLRSRYKKAHNVKGK